MGLLDGTNAVHATKIRLPCAVFGLLQSSYDWRTKVGSEPALLAILKQVLSIYRAEPRIQQLQHEIHTMKLDTFDKNQST